MAELNEYLHFAGPARRDKALHTLVGLLRGLGIDGPLNDHEKRELRDWLVMNGRHAEKCPSFAELVSAATTAIADGIITTEEQSDLLGLCDRLSSNSEYYGAMTLVIQELHGMLHGIIADGRVTAVESASLLEWLHTYDGLRKMWPFTEIESLLVSVTSDGVISNEEQAKLVWYFAQFADLSVDSPVRKQISIQPKHLTVQGVCAVDPEILFRDRNFCFTGLSRRASRAECHSIVRKHGGHCVENVSGELNYLVICAEGNPCWAYACYGRKVEEAMWRRRDRGQDLSLIHEADFWDSVVA